jgi:hypothetical protein
VEKIVRTRSPQQGSRAFPISLGNPIHLTFIKFSHPNGIKVETFGYVESLGDNSA